MCALAQLLMASRRKRCIELTFAPFEGVLRNPFFVRQKPPKEQPALGMFRRSSLLSYFRHEQIGPWERSIDRVWEVSKSLRIKPTKKHSFGGLGGCFKMFQIGPRLSSRPRFLPSHHSQQKIIFNRRCLSWLIKQKAFPTKPKPAHCSPTDCRQSFSSCAPQPFSFAS